ncbi:MAG: copper oxidase, partial [Brooklawnia sp.]
MAHAEPGAAPKPGRGRWPLRDYPSIGWLLLAIVVAIMHRQLVWGEWLLVHLLLLGALSHAVLVWSFYFSETLLRAPASHTSRRDQNIRITGLLLGASGVLLGLPLGWWWLVVAGAAAVSVAVAWHGLALWQMLQRALPGRFRITLRYYMAAAASLILGATLGAILARGPSGDWHGRLLIGHSMANLLGWIGLTVTGTLVTFWPTLLRTRMDDRAERLARQALPGLLVGLAVVITGALLGRRELAAAGLAVYLLGLVWWGRALARPLRTKPPREFSSASVGMAMPWAVVGLGWVGVLLLTSGSWAELSAGFTPVAVIFAVGVGAQLLLGALSYLIPAVLGGGPAAARAGLARFNTAGTLRLVLVNTALLFFLLPVPPAVKLAVAVLGGLALASFLPIMFAAIKAQRGAAETVETPPTIWSGGQLVAALAALSMAVTVGVGVDPAAAGFLPLAPGSGSQGSVAPTGEVVRVQVSAGDMVFAPDNVTVNPGDQLVIELVNDDPTNIHDLAVGGQGTRRLAPGESAELDLGVITESVQGWCTIAGHRQMGMVFDVLVAGQDAAGDTGGHDAGHVPGGLVTADQGIALTNHVDPVLGPLSEQRVHQLTFEVEELPLEVAPGVWQQRWTFNGSPVGPTLHGRVGDVFEITLVNNGTMGHSIDFHAGELAPDEPMRTIPPGESL